MFSLNSLNSVTKKYLKKKISNVGLEPRISCVRDRDDTTRPQTQVTDQILILNPIHASVIPQIL